MKTRTPLALLIALSACSPLSQSVDKNRLPRPQGGGEVGVAPSREEAFRISSSVPDLPAAEKEGPSLELVLSEDSNAEWFSEFRKQGSVTIPLELDPVDGTALEMDILWPTSGMEKSADGFRVAFRPADAPQGAGHGGKKKYWVLSVAKKVPKEASEIVRKCLKKVTLRIRTAAAPPS